MNYDTKEHSISFQAEGWTKPWMEKRTDYQVTSDDLQSKQVIINGIVATFPNDPNETPNFMKYAKIGDPKGPVLVQPHSYSFIKYETEC